MCLILAIKFDHVNQPEVTNQIILLYYKIQQISCIIWFMIYPQCDMVYFYLKYIQRYYEVW